jgi:hypothetical protein
MTPHKHNPDIENARMVSRHDRVLAAEAEAFHQTSSGASVELTLVDAGHGGLLVVMSAKAAPGVSARRESYPLDGQGLAQWLKTKLAAHCMPAKRGAQ